MRLLWFLAVFCFLTGCVTVRSYTVEEPRTDLDIQGNQGYLSGTSNVEFPENRLGDTRQISVFEVEFLEAKTKDKPDKKGKKAVADSKKKSSPKEKFTEWEEEESTEFFIEDVDLVDSKINIESDDQGEIYSVKEQDYTVGKNDTLQKISSKFYGTTRKWQKIYDANSQILKSPDKLYPGMVLRIPE